MTEFHKKESEELEKEHDKLYELLEEDKKKVAWISLVEVLICYILNSCLQARSRVPRVWLSVKGQGCQHFRLSDL